jgi:bacillolysin
MRPIIRLAVLGFVLTSTLAVAQQKKSGRPFKDVDVSKVPTVHSLDEYVQKYKGVPSFGNGNVTSGVASKETHVPIAQGKITSTPNAQNKPVSVWKIARAANGTVNWMWNLHTGQNPVPQSVKTDAGMKVLTDLKQTLKIENPTDEFRLMSDVKDELGCDNIRYAQYYKGIPVWNRDLYVHLGSDGYPSVINGTYEPTPTGVNTTAGIVPEAAMIVCIRDLQVQQQWAPIAKSASIYQALSAQPEAKLVIFPIEGKQPKLAYEVSINANLLQSYFYIIDAATGEIIQRTDHYCSLIGDPKLRPSKISHTIVHGGADPYPLIATEPFAMPQAGFQNASGKDLNGVTQQFRAYQHTDGNYYLIWDLPSFNVGTSTLPDNPTGGALTLNLNNQDYAQGSSIFHNVSQNNTWNDAAAVSAHFNTSVAYNYYSTNFTRKAIDDKNGVIASIVHVTQNGGGMDNAFWNGGGKVMIYGDGKTDFKPLAGGLDVAGHEMTHGVTENSANLVYQAQSGALNESMSDVFGVMIDPANLTLGEQVMKSSQFSCLRDMANPHNPTALADQPAKMSEFQNLSTDQDNGGVHVNSGIPNHAAAILIQQLGRDKVQKIYYRALTKYLTRDAQFLDCRRAVIAAAKDLFGASSAEVTAAGSAFDQVEIFDGGGGGGGNNDKVPPQTGGHPYVAFHSTGGIVGLSDYAVTPAGAIIFDQAPPARLGSQGESSAILTTPRTGDTIYYINSTGHLSRIILSVTQSTFETFNNLKITDDGDLWNVAVSPDGRFLAITSAYTDDPNLYFWDLNANHPLVKMPLKPESTDGGAIASIDYPDVISWSPNKWFPKISVDAFNKDKVGNTNIGYWSIYETDFNAKRTYSMIPAADGNIDIGNICYSNTNPELVVFNSIDAGGNEDVVLADFDSNVVVSLGVPFGTVRIPGNANPIVDANRPTLTYDDGLLVFSTEANKSIMFFDGTGYQYLQYQFPLSMPYAFLFKGSADVKQKTIADKFSLSVSPSIVRNTGEITVSLAEPETITLDVVNILGVTVRPIVNKHFDSGTTLIAFDRAGLSSGTYFIRLRGAGEQKMIKIIIE